MEYRHWMCRHELEETSVLDMHSLLKTIADLLPYEEKLYWRLVCDMYEARDYPDWFIELTGEKNDY